MYSLLTTLHTAQVIRVLFIVRSCCHPFANLDNSVAIRCCQVNQPCRVVLHLALSHELRNGRIIVHNHSKRFDTNLKASQQHRKAEIVKRRRKRHEIDNDPFANVNVPALGKFREAEIYIGTPTRVNLRIFFQTPR